MGLGQRRRWSDEEKARIVAETLQSATTVTAVASAAAPGKRETLYFPSRFLASSNRRWAFGSVHVSRGERNHALDPRTRRFVVEAGASAFDEEA